MKSYFLKLTSAIVIDGKIVTRGAIVEVNEREAKNFLARGKAVLATVEDGIEPDDEPANDDEPQVDLTRLNKAQLVEVAKSKGIEGADGMTKAELFDAIAASEAE